tara:strand:+ start:454 stop:1350 length:897 start_codon:yes stop_codon:yes gene_type:complete
MDDEADVLGRFMYLMDQYDRKERSGGYLSVPDYLYKSLERVLQSSAAIEQDIINQLIMVNIRDDRLMTPLQYVYENGQLNLFEIFLKNGADPNTQVVNNANLPESILMYCIRNLRYNLIEYVKLLLKYGANVNYTSNGGTALHYAAANNNIEAVQLILKYFPDTRLTDEDGETARDVAEDYGYDEIVDLIDKYNADNTIQGMLSQYITKRRLENELIDEQSKALEELLPDSEFIKPYISPMRDRRELMRTLARDRRQQMTRKKELEEGMRTARFLRELEQYGGRRRRKRTRKKYRYRV